nr:indolepyruvate ferredoxin oxidoreductase subunit alpha [uncultured Holophaga sp.]
MKKLLTGDEAVAQGAWEAGVRFASAYPGTPSTEILENIALFKEDIIAEWASNEKVAMEAAIGASLAGARSLCAQKHVGLNVAADPLFTVAYTGVNGGLVMITADEPGQHSSQNEQDNRHFARAAKVPMLEPSTSQESKDMVRVAMELSEAYDTPVLFRMTTRVCHSKGIVECGGREEFPLRPYLKNVRKNVVVPANAIPLRLKVEERSDRLRTYAESTPLNFTEMHEGRIGVITSGVCYCYAKEVFGDTVSYLKLGFTWPLPEEKLRSFCEQMETLYVIEENDPYLEEAVRQLGFTCHGKDTFPFNGEMTPDVIRKAVFGQGLDAVPRAPEKVVPRPPTLCAGCPHRGLFHELGKRKGVVIAGDIGCYTLAFTEPYNAMDWCQCMGSSTGTGHGAQKIFNLKTGEDKKRVVAVHGDSTFFHTALNGLVNIAYNRSNTITVILDNRITGMTGHQENPASGCTLQGMVTPEIEIETVVKALGFQNVLTVNPNDLAAMRHALDWALANEDEPSVIITRWPCVLKQFSEQDRTEFPGAFSTKFTIDPAKCIGCQSCVRTGCPAISFDKSAKKAIITRDMCVGCGICAQVCPPKVRAISQEVK